MADDEVNPLLLPGEVATVNYGWTKPMVGGSGDAWGGEWNANLDGIDATVFGMLPKSGGTLTGALTPSQTAGIVGTTTNNNANAGAVGEFVSAAQMSNVGMTNGVAVNIISISLTAGDWDVEGILSVVFSGNGNQVLGAISTVSATIPATYPGSFLVQDTSSAIPAAASPTGTARVLISATTTVYLVGRINMASGTCQGQGSIQARRMR